MKAMQAAILQMGKNRTLLIGQLCTAMAVLGLVDQPPQDTEKVARASSASRVTIQHR